ncbi:MAG: 1-acyl-sn-glycerol-3-phosphate acyltransferase, partial [Candidatus Acidiferrales bacterium]
NHPNSVADAFLVAARLTPRRINFIAKDTITGAPVVGWLARQFGVVGVARAYEYERQRDMARKRNEAAIGTCIPRLLAGEVVVIFGEGISTDVRRLHMIRKGAMRFGYAAERAAGFTLGLKWIPVGINYSAKQRFRSDVALRVGVPFGLSELHPDPAAHEADVLKRGTARLQRDIAALMVNIEKEELTGLIDRLTTLLENPQRPFADAVEGQQALVRAVEFFNTAEPQRLAELEKQLTGYNRRLAATGLSDEVIRQRRPQKAVWSHVQGVVLNGGLLALNLYGLVNSFFPRWAATAAAWLQSLSSAGATGPEGHPAGLTKEALWATLGGWVGAGIAFPLQTFVVYRLAEGAWGPRAAAAAAVLYALSLLPSWWLFVRRRDIFREHLNNLRHAVRFLASAQSAGRLRVHRRRLERQARTLVADYRAAGPRAA